MTFVQLSFYQEPKCIGLNQALEYSPLSPPTILFRHSLITTMSSYQNVNIGQYTDIYVSHANQLVWGISANQNYESAANEKYESSAGWPWPLSRSKRQADTNDEVQIYYLCISSFFILRECFYQSLYTDKTLYSRWFV